MDLELEASNLFDVSDEFVCRVSRRSPTVATGIVVAKKLNVCRVDAAGLTAKPGNTSEGGS